MYLPRIFEATDRDRIHRLIEAHPFATLVVARDREPEISHLPVILDLAGDHGRLRAHCARANPLAKLVTEGAPVCVIFHGPDAYVSPTWYERPTEQVPTWNYAVVHAHGRLRESSRDELLTLLADLTDRFEAGSEKPWRVSDLEPAFVDELCMAIVGFSIDIERLEAKLKLSQNRSPADHERVRRAFAALVDPNARALAGLMAAD